MKQLSLYDHSPISAPNTNKPPHDVCGNMPDIFVSLLLTLVLCIQACNRTNPTLVQPPVSFAAHALHATSPRKCNPLKPRSQEKHASALNNKAKKPLCASKAKVTRKKSSRTKKQEPQRSSRNCPKKSSFPFEFLPTPLSNSHPIPHPLHPTDALPLPTNRSQQGKKHVAPTTQPPSPTLGEKEGTGP